MNLSTLLMTQLLAQIAEARPYKEGDKQKRGYRRKSPRSNLSTGVLKCEA